MNSKKRKSSCDCALDAMKNPCFEQSNNSTNRCCNCLHVLTFAQYALDQADQAIVLLGDRTKVFYGNNKFCSLMDVAVEELINREFPFIQLFGNDGNNLKRCILQGSSTTLDCTNQHQNQIFTITILPYSPEYTCCLFSKQTTVKPQTNVRSAHHVSNVQLNPSWAVFSVVQSTQTTEVISKGADVNDTIFNAIAPSLQQVVIDFSTTQTTKQYMVDTAYGRLKFELSSIGQNVAGKNLVLVHWKQYQGAPMRQTLSMKNWMHLAGPHIEVVMRMFFDNSPIRMGIAKLQEDDIEFLLVNAAMAGQFGMTTQQFNGKTTSQIGFSKLDIEKWRSNYLKCRETQEPIHWEYQTDSSTGRPVLWFKVIASHLEEDIFIFLAHHITEFKQMDSELSKHKAELENKIQERTRELQEALQIKSRFLAVMSHEMRTPLSGVLGTMSLLEDTSLTSDQKDLVRITQVCGQQLLSVINDVLDLSKLEENKMTIESIPFNIRNTLEDSMEVVAFEAHKKGLELVACIDSNFPETIIGDPGRLRQIIVNLLGNAVKFSVQGEIVLRAKVKTGRRRSVFFGPTPDKERKILQEIEISVEDSGVGIKETEQHKLFQAFTQIDSSHTRRHGGTGLGLSISKKLAELMNGRMKFQSTYGQGSTFSVTLTAELPTQTQITTNLMEMDDNDVDMMDGYWNINLPTSEKVFKDKRVLIADPSAVRSMHLQETLGHWGIDATILHSKEELEFHLTSATQPLVYHAAIVDTRLGLEVVTKLEALTFVILSGYSQEITENMKKYPMIKHPLRQVRLQETLTQVLLQKEKRRLSDTNPKPPLAKFNRINTSLRVLVVEDNMMNQTIIHKLLLSLKLPESQISMAENGLKAIEAVKQTTFDVVFMDMMMPEMGGIEATEWIRKEYGKTPIIIALTANAFMEDRRKCIEAGMQDVLTKPIRKQELAQVLMKYFPQ